MARKNANGDGSRPRKRPDGRWEARYWAETPSGRKRRSVYGSSRKDCAEKLAEAISVKEDFVPVPADITVGEFLNQHLEAAKETLKKRTWEGHEETVRVHLMPSLGHLKLKELTRSHVQSLYTAKRAGGLSPGTVRSIHAVLSAALSSAVRWRLRGGCNFLIVSDASGVFGPERKYRIYRQGHRLLLIAMDQVRSLRARVIFHHSGERGAAGVYLMIGQTAKKVLRESGLSDEEIELMSAGCLPDEDVKAAAQFSTTLRRLKDMEFDRIYWHGWEVADCNLRACHPDLFASVPRDRRP